MDIGAWAAGSGGVRRFEAPVEIPGWQENPWVLVRALTEAEALERESLGLIEEYELVARGLEEPELRVRRVYDLVAMAEYEWERCLVDWCLPEVRPAEGETEPLVVVKRREGERAADLTFLRGMGPCLGAWLKHVLDEVNWRLPEQRAQLEIAKKN